MLGKIAAAHSLTLQKLVQYLSHAVSFDIDGIESTTRPLCQVIPPFDDRPGKEIRPKYPDGSNTSHYPAELPEYYDRTRLAQGPVQVASKPLPLQSQAPASDMLKDESSYDPIMALPPLSFPPVGNAVWNATIRGYQQVSHVIVFASESLTQLTNEHRIPVLGTRWSISLRCNTSLGLIKSQTTISTTSSRLPTLRRVLNLGITNRHHLRRPGNKNAAARRVGTRNQGPLSRYNITWPQCAKPSIPGAMETTIRNSLD